MIGQYDSKGGTGLNDHTGMRPLANPARIVVSKVVNKPKIGDKGK